MDGLKCTKDASARFDIADNLKIILFVFHGLIGKHNNFKSVRKKNMNNGSFFSKCMIFHIFDMKII